MFFKISSKALETERDEQRQYVTQYKHRMYPLLISGFIFVAIFAYLVVTERIDFPKLTKTNPKRLSDMQSRMAFVVLHLTPGLGWLCFSMCLVAIKRIQSPAINPLNGYEVVVEAAKNNLTNTLEQFVMLAMCQFILTLQVSARTLINVIPAINILFLIGRITFWLGYPCYRAFGFVVTQTPIFCTVLYLLYKYIETHIIFENVN